MVKQWLYCFYQFEHQHEFREPVLILSFVELFLGHLLTWKCVLSVSETYTVTGHSAMHGRIQRGQRVRTPPNWKITRNRLSQQYWSGFPEKSQTCKASIQSWAIIGTPAILLYSGIWILSLTTKKRCQSWSPSDETFWIRACYADSVLACTWYI